MPSPFPGMDPYLEDNAHWPGFHQWFNTLMCGALNVHLPNRYVAALNQRLYLVEPDCDIYPDVDVKLRRPSGTNGGAVQVVEGVAADPVLVVEREEVRESFVEIIIPGDEGRVVTAIETLSPSNKAAGSAGRREYRRKQRRVLGSDAHLLEIDLLRKGKHAVATPRELLARRAKYDYLVSLSREADRDRFETWPFSIRQRLPRVLVPLAGGDADIVLDLQAVLDRCYDEGAFARVVDYRREPRHSLAAEHADWAVAMLAEGRLRVGDRPGD